MYFSLPKGERCQWWLPSSLWLARRRKEWKSRQNSMMAFSCAFAFASLGSLLLCFFLKFYNSKHGTGGTLASFVCLPVIAARRITPLVHCMQNAYKVCLDRH